MRRFQPQIWIPRALYAAYCGEKSEACLRHYDKALHGGNPMAFSFNLLAILCCPAWLGYRQRWKLLAVFTAVNGILAVTFDALGLAHSGGASLGIGITVGMAARGFLLTEANMRYAQLLERHLGEDAVRVALANQAAPRPVFAILGLVASLLMHLGILLLGEWLFVGAGGTR